MTLQPSDRAGLDLVLSLANVSRETEGRLLAYMRLLRQWQAKINLIAPSTLDIAWARHFADSVQLYLIAPTARHWIDIGSGAGFPGLVVAIMLADEFSEGDGGEVHLVESVGKKCAFMRQVVRDTGLSDAGISVTVHQNRIEQALPRQAVPDVVSARALANLSALLTQTEGLLSHGTTGLFSKGEEFRAEVDQAQKDWNFQMTCHPSRLAENSVILEIRQLQRKSGQAAS